MPKVAFFGHISPNFFHDLFFYSASPNLFTLLDLEILFLDFLDLKNIFSPKKPLFFLDLKNFFLDLKNFFRLFRPKNTFLDFLLLKIFSNRLNSLEKHLLNLQSHEKNYIFNFSSYSKK